MSKFDTSNNDPSADSSLPASPYSKPLGLRIGESEREAANHRIDRLFRDGYLRLDELDIAHNTVAEATTQEQLDAIFDGFPLQTAQTIREKNSLMDQESTLRKNRLEIIGIVNSLVWPVSVLFWSFLDLLLKWEYSWAVFVVAGVVSIVTQVLLWDANKNESPNS